MNFISLATTNGEWIAGLGDPTPMGWFTVGAYFASAVLCLCCAARPLFSSKAADSRADLRFWLIIAGLMVVFGINKQLDLQTLFTATFKSIVEAMGLYSIRGLLQLGFIALVVVGGIWLAWKFFLKYRRSAQRNRLAVTGIALLAIFVAMRATSFHYMDSLINTTVLGLKMNWIVELGSIALIAMAAIIHLRRHRRQSSWQGQLASDARTGNVRRQRQTGTNSHSTAQSKATSKTTSKAAGTGRQRSSGFKPASRR